MSDLRFFAENLTMVQEVLNKAGIREQERNEGCGV